MNSAELPSCVAVATIHRADEGKDTGHPPPIESLPGRDIHQDGVEGDQGNPGQYPKGKALDRIRDGQSVKGPTQEAQKPSRRLEHDRLR